MKAAIERILASHGLLDAFRSNDEFYVKIAHPPFMPLTIEKHCSRVVIAHYFEQGGDLIADPDMEFEIIGDRAGEWCPVAIQHSTGHYFRAVEYFDGVRHVDPRQMKDQRAFARQWSRNLLDQGFAHGTVVRSETD